MSRTRNADGTFAHEGDTWDRLFRHRMVAGDCWLWEGAVRARGASGKGEPYGGVRFGGTIVLVHRLAFFLARGYWPNQADHICRTTLCFRPDHIQDATSAGNAARRDQRAVLAALDRGRKTRWGEGVILPT